MTDPDLLARYEALVAPMPHPPHARDAAAMLCVSEGALVEARRATGAAAPLAVPAGMGALLAAFAGCAEMMALTRNAWCVLEMDGRYGPGGLDLVPDLARWHVAYRLTETTQWGRLTSVQVFDATGVALHKAYATPATDTAAFAALLAAWEAPDAPPKTFAAPPPEPAPVPDPVRALAPVRRYLEHAARDGRRLTVSLANPGMAATWSGQVHAVKTSGPWLNVLDPGFNLHLHGGGAAAVDEACGALTVRDATGAAVCRIGPAAG